MSPHADDDIEQVKHVKWYLGEFESYDLNIEVEYKLRALRAQIAATERLEEQARLKIAAAQNTVVAQGEETKRLEDSGDQTFLSLRDKLCGGDGGLARHLWRACDLDGALACGLHLDDQDAGCVLVCILGLILRVHT